MAKWMTINGKQVVCEKGETVLEVATKAGIYIPTLCARPDLPSIGVVVRTTIPSLAGRVQEFGYDRYPSTSMIHNLQAPIDGRSGLAHKVGI